jgi:hypothetical protein
MGLALVMSAHSAGAHTELRAIVSSSALLRLTIRLSPTKQSSLADACVAKDRLTAIGRLDAKQQQLQALRKGLDTIKPVLSKFEESLNDSQRTRLAIAITG